MKTKREIAFTAFYCAVQTAVGNAPEADKEAIEDTLSAYFEALEAEGFEEETIPPEDSWELFTEVWPISARQEAALTRLGEALRDYCQAEESPEAEKALEESVKENAPELEKAGFSVFVPEGKGFKEVK